LKINKNSFAIPFVIIFRSCLLTFYSRSPQNQPNEHPPLLKSSSAGLIKCPTVTAVTPPPPPPRRLELKRLEIKIDSDYKEANEPPPSPLDESIDLTLQAYRKKPASPLQVCYKTILVCILKLIYVSINF